MFRDPVSFSGMCIRPDVNTRDMSPGPPTGRRDDD
jgi:hypothetical protein